MRDADLSRHVYALCDPDSGHVRYIGSTQGNLRKRLRGHIAQSRRSAARGPLVDWIRALREAGKEPTVRLVIAYAGRSDYAENDLIRFAKSTFAPDLLNVFVRRPSHITRELEQDPVLASRRP